MKKIFILVITFITVFALTACEGTKERTINVYTRDTSSGTRSGFMGYIGFDDAKSDDSVLVEGFNTAGNDEIINAVKTDVNAIGYVSMSTLSSEFKAVQFNGVDATEANVLNGTYVMARNFNYMLRDSYDFDNSGIVEGNEETIQLISEAWVAYIQTKTGKVTISGADGIVDITTGDTWNDIKDSHQVCDQDNSSITIKFGGSDSVEKVARALSADFSAKCGGFITEHNHTGSSNAYKGLNGENSAPNDNLFIHIGFASREFKPEESALSTGVVARDAIVVVVHLDNEVKSLSPEQLKSIYKGEITTWNVLQ